MIVGVIITDGATIEVKQLMRVHMYAAGSGEARTLVVEPNARLREFVEHVGDEQIFVVDDTEEDADLDGDLLTADLDATAATVFGAGPGHVVSHACRMVSVSVSYAGGEQTVQVRPSTRLRRLRRKAIKAFGIGSSDSADLVLRAPGSDQDLDLTLPVGAIVPPRSCEATVDLVHTVRPQG